MSLQKDSAPFFDLLGNLEIREKALKKLACKVKEGIRVLDLATGSGYLARNLSEKSLFLVCLDVDLIMLCKTRENLPDHLYVRADAGRLPFKGSSFDCVVTWSALAHVKDWKRVVDESCRVSKSLFTAEPHGAFSVRAFRDLNCKHRCPKITEILSEFERHGRANIDHMDFISIISIIDTRAM